MSQRTQISWCDCTYNPWIGCTQVSLGCDNCYALTIDTNRYSKTMDGGTKETPVSHWGHGAPRHRTGTAPEVLKWNQRAYAFCECSACGWRGDGKDAKEITDSVKHCPSCKERGVLRAGARRRVFCASLADWLDSEVPIEWLADLLDLIFRTPGLDWLLLTKRPQNFRARIEQCVTSGLLRRVWVEKWLAGEPPLNVWIGTTAENQKFADLRIPHLLKIPAKVRFLSCEPLLGDVNITQWLAPDTGLDFVAATREERELNSLSRCIDWVIAGGESGKGARPMHPAWARSLRDQCAEARVPFHFKQWGEWTRDSVDEERVRIHDYAGVLPNGEAALMSQGYEPPFDDMDRLTAAGGVRLDGRTLMVRVGKKAAGRLLDGVEHNAFPEVSK